MCVCVCVCVTQAFDLLHKVARFKPDIAFHLGDVYYSGTEKEEVEYVYQ